MQVDTGIYLAKNGIVVRLPVNPGEVNFGFQGNNKTYDIINLGQVVQPSETRLRTVSFSSFFPTTQHFSGILTNGDFRDGEFYINLLFEWADSKEPFRFILTRFLVDGTMIMDENFEVVLESFDYQDRAGEMGDYYYTLSLLEYRQYNPAVISVIDTNPTTIFNVGQEGNTIAVSTEPQRDVSSDELCRGDNVIVNGTYYYTSYGDGPTGNASNLHTTITRIVDQGIAVPAQKYRYHVGNYGWVTNAQLQKV